MNSNYRPRLGDCKRPKRTSASKGLGSPISSGERSGRLLLGSRVVRSEHLHVPSLHERVVLGRGVAEAPGPRQRSTGSNRIEPVREVSA